MKRKSGFYWVYLYKPQNRYVAQYIPSGKYFLLPGKEDAYYENELTVISEERLTLPMGKKKDIPKKPCEHKGRSISGRLGQPSYCEDCGEDL